MDHDYMRIFQAVLIAYTRKILVHYFAIALVLLGFFSINSVFASVKASNKLVKIGVLAYRPKAETLGMSTN
jgi:hypothetical protein